MPSLSRIQVSILSQHLDTSLLRQSIDIMHVNPFEQCPSVGHFLHLDFGPRKNRPQSYLSGTCPRFLASRCRFCPNTWTPLFRDNRLILCTLTHLSSAQVSGIFYTWTSVPGKTGLRAISVGP